MRTATIIISTIMVLGGAILGATGVYAPMNGTAHDVAFMRLGLELASMPIMLAGLIGALSLKD